MGQDETHDIEVHANGETYEVTVDGKLHVVDARKLESNFYSLLVKGRSYEVSVEGDDEDFEVRHGAALRTVRLVDPLRAASGAELGDTGRAVIEAVMPGRVVRLLVEEGQEVEAGQGVLVLEAMKMENEVAAPRAGTVSTLKVAQGETVETGQMLAVVE
jgi:biotin carboxyl carrier protein